MGDSAVKCYINIKIKYQRNFNRLIGKLDKPQNESVNMKRGQ